MMRRRGYSDSEVDAYVEQEQHRRAAARRADPGWVLVEDEWSGALGGGV